MHPQQAHARFNLIVTVSALILVASSYGISFTLYGPERAMSAFAFLGVLGLWGFGSRFYRKDKGGPSIVMDERDEKIKQRSLVIAWAVQWLFLGLICMVPWFFITFVFGSRAEEEPTMLVSQLPLLFIATAMVHTLAWSISVLALYKKGAVGSAG